MIIKKCKGGYRAEIRINGKTFVADLRMSALAIPEVTIFPTRQGKISKWRPIPVYTAWPEAVTLDTLKKHIFMFAATNP